jgi:hypothetical protein
MGSFGQITYNKKISCKCTFNVWEVNCTTLKNITSVSVFTKQNLNYDKVRNSVFINCYIYNI